MAEAINIVYYVINHTPSSATELKAPIEIRTIKPVDDSNLHIFGSLVYVMYNTKETTKQDTKSKKCIYLGYADGA